MRPAVLVRFASVALAVPVVLACLRPRVQASPPLAGAAGDREESPPVIYYERPVSAEAARTWLKLHKKVDMPFKELVPLDDVLKYLREQTADREQNDRGLRFYLVPITGAEFEIQTAVQIDLKDIPVATTLTLILQQLGMAYRVHEDGFIIIASEDDELVRGPSAPALDQFAALRREVAALRNELRVLQSTRRR